MVEDFVHSFDSILTDFIKTPELDACFDETDPCVTLQSYWLQGMHPNIHKYVTVSFLVCIYL